MSVFEQPLTRADFDRCHWEGVIAGIAEKSCQNYSGPFIHRSNTARDVGDPVAQAVFAVLFVVTDVELRHHDINQPFGPRFVAQAGRGVASEDLNDQHWDILAELGPTISDAEMRARVCDLVWVVKRKHEHGKKAVEAYLESARSLWDPDMWPPSAWRLERALRLARSIRGANGLFDSTVQHFEDLVTGLRGEDPRFMTGILMQLLLEFKKGDPAKYAPLAEKAAGLAEDAKDFDRACKLWLIASHWHRMAGDTAANERCRIRSAETYVKDAEIAAAKGKQFTPNIQAAWRMERAVEALSKINTPASRELLAKYYPLLTEYQEKGRAELPSFSHSIDMAQAATYAEKQVAGKSLEIALYILLGSMCKPATVGWLREQAKGYFRSPILGFMGVTRVNSRGKIAARAPQFDSTPEGAEEAVLAQMYNNAILHRKCVAVGQVIPAIRIIRDEHNVRLQDFYDLADTSPFVPPGREMAFARGLFAGFTFDTMVSTSLLIPQVENSIRNLLEANGAIASGFDKQWRQNDFDLNTTLHMAELKQIYDDDLIFDLQGLLVEHHGSNLRNEMAHGLLDDGQMLTEECMYLWALVLRLCLMRPRRQDNQANEPTTPPEGGAGEGG
jgi:hypothetical protein